MPGKSRFFKTSQVGFASYYQIGIKTPVGCQRLAEHRRCQSCTDPPGDWPGPWAVGPDHLRAALLESDRVEVPLEDQWRVPYLLEAASRAAPRPLLRRRGDRAAAARAHRLASHQLASTEAQAHNVLIRQLVLGFLWEREHWHKLS